MADVTSVRELEKQFYPKLTDVVNEYKRALEGLLKLTGYDGDVVEKKTGKKGRLTIVNSYYNSLGYEVKFYPYKKDGELSKNASGWFWDLSNYEVVKNESDCDNN